MKATSEPEEKDDLDENSNEEEEQISNRYSDSLKVV